MRDHFQAVFFGTGMISSAWEIAYMLPNMLRNLLAEGVLSQAFVPIYSSAIKESEARARRVAGVVLVYLSGLLVLLVLAGTLLFPLLMPAYTARSGEDAVLVVFLATVLFPFILTASLSAIFMGMANTRQSFLLPSLSPVLLNLIFIAGFLLILAPSRSQEENIKTLAFITIGGGAAQLIFQGWHVWRSGWWPEFSTDHSDPALRKVWTLMAPAILGAGIFHLNQIMDVAIASYWIEDKGAITGIRFAQRLIQLPTGVIGVALSTAILPVLAQAIREEKRERIPHELSHALSFSFFLNVPAAIGLFMLGPEIINLLFYGGSWDLKSTDLTWQALQFYCLGVPLYSTNRILTSSFYAHEDTRTPVRILVAVVLVNLCMNLVLVHPMAQGGLALSSSISACLNSVLLYAALRRHIDGLTIHEAAVSLLRQLPGYGLLIGFLLAVKVWLPDLLTAAGIHSASPRTFAAVAVALGGGGGGLLYLASGFAMNLPELAFLRRRFRLTER